MSGPLQKGWAGWSLGVHWCIQYHLSVVGISHGGGGDNDDGDQSVDRPRTCASELLCSKVVSTTGLGGSRGISILETLTETHTSMGVWGRHVIHEACDTLCAST